MSRQDFTLRSYADPLSSFHRLVRSLLAVECVDSLQVILKTVAPPENISFYLDCIYTAGNLGSRFPNSLGASSRVRRTLESLLIDCALHHFFKPKYSPFILHSLVQVEPLNFWSHIELLGDNLSMLGAHDAEQKRLAHLTATRILNQTPKFIEYSDRFKFADNESQHFWLFEALFSEAGPLTLSWTDADLLRPKVVRRSAPDILVPVKANADWIQFQPANITQQKFPVGAATVTHELMRKLMLGLPLKEEQ
jgi:hypothetical protein